MLPASEYYEGDLLMIDGQVRAKRVFAVSLREGHVNIGSMNR